MIALEKVYFVLERTMLIFNFKILVQACLNMHSIKKERKETKNPSIPKQKW